MSIDNSKKSPRLLQSRRYTHDTFTDAQEAFTSVLDINANEIYVDQDLIPVSSIPLGTSGDNLSIYSSGGQQVMKYYYRYKMTKSSTNNEVWFFTTGTTAGIDAQLIDSSQKTNFISPKYSIPSLSTANAEDSPAGYGVKVFVSTNASSPSAGDQISSTKFVFDYKTGVLQFVLTADAPTTSQYVYISAYQYVGRTLKDALLTTGGTGTSGTSGTSGTGTSGTSGSSGSAGYEGHLGIWKYSGNTNTAIDPTPGFFNLDSAAWGTSTTSISIDNVAYSPNTNFSAYLDSLTIGTILKLVKVGDTSTFKLLKIDVVLPYDSGFENYTVSQLSSGGTDPNDNDQFLIIPLGIPGLTGTAGTSGSNGTNGSSGTSGINGTSGSNGTDGTSGTNGSSGSNGTNGSSGTSGSNGTNGSSGSSGSNGTNGSSGSSGTSGSNGTNGSSGTSGTNGTSGSNGTNGSSGSSGDSLFGHTGSFWATTNDIQITGSLSISSQLGISDANVLLNDSASIVLTSGSNIYIENGGFITASFKGDGAGLYNIPASGVTGLQLDRIIGGSVSASMADGTLRVNTDVNIDGTLTAREIHTTYVTSSVLYSSGSTKFGDTQDDRHSFTGSLYTTGSVVINGNLTVNGTTVLTSTDLLRESLIVSGAMAIMNAQIQAQFISASLSMQGQVVISQQGNVDVMDCGDGFI